MVGAALGVGGTRGLGCAGRDWGHAWHRGSPDSQGPEVPADSLLLQLEE